jgi:hypothetical protein
VIQTLVQVLARTEHRNVLFDFSSKLFIKRELNCKRLNFYPKLALCPTKNRKDNSASNNYCTFKGEVQSK